ncbi:hypothetical protein ACWEPL_43350 [Nonomuraea sp. NPDC004186]
MPDTTVMPALPASTASPPCPGPRMPARTVDDTGHHTILLAARVAAAVAEIP